MLRSALPCATATDDPKWKNTKVTAAVDTSDRTIEVIGSPKSGSHPARGPWSDRQPGAMVDVCPGSLSDRLGKLRKMKAGRRSCSAACRQDYYWSSPLVFRFGTN